MDINDLVLSDEALAVIDEGRWMKAGPLAPGVEFLVCGMESESAQKIVQEEQAKFRLKNEGLPLTGEQHTEVTREALIEGVLKDWRGLTSGGKELKYSKDQARTFITMRGGDKFAGLVLAAAQLLDKTARSYIEEVSKN